MKEFQGAVGEMIERNWREILEDPALWLMKPMKWKPQPAGCLKLINGSTRPKATEYWENNQI